MQAYLDLIQKILDEGTAKSNRTGIRTRSLFGHRMCFDLRAGYPLVTTKKTAFQLIISELLWFLSGSDNIADLNRGNNHIWDEWADENGSLGPIYGVQWRSWPTAEGKQIDQIAALIRSLRHDPNSRRHIVSAWNVGALSHMRLAPCHCLFQFDLTDGVLSCQVYQRSTDVFLGLPFNIASYAALTHMIAQVTASRPGQLIHISGDTHLYDNHLDQARILLKRTPYPLPQLKLNRARCEIDEFVIGDFRLEGYCSHSTLHGAVAV